MKDLNLRKAYNHVQQALHALQQANVQSRFDNNSKNIHTDEIETLLSTAEHKLLHEITLLKL